MSGRNRFAVLLAGLVAGAAAGIRGQPAPASAQSLTVQQLVERVLQSNEAVQEKLLDFEISRREYRSSRGVFEPVAFGSASHEWNRRQNNTEQVAADQGVAVLQEVNSLFEGGVEGLAPTGADVRVGYTMSKLWNNVPPSVFASPLAYAQYQSFAGISVTQPLLKNFGTTATMADIRLAALSSTIAFQEYRQALMTKVGEAEAGYWNLYLAQAQVGFFEESVRTAERVLRDTRTRFGAGTGARLDVLQAQAALNLRQAKLNDARGKVVDATDRILELYGQRPGPEAAQFVLADEPRLDRRGFDRVTLAIRAVRLNPDYLIQEEKTKQDEVRLGYARNQRRFELNLQGAYGLNGLALDPYQSLLTTERAGYPSWSFGLEVKIPILGGVKGRNDLAAAHVQLTKSELALQGVLTEIDSGLDTAMRKAELSRASVANYQQSANYNQDLLRSALVQLDAGKLDSRDVLDIEADLLDAKVSLVESEVQYKLAELELALIDGGVLQDLNLELTQAQLQQRTDRLAKAKHWDDDAYRAALARVLSLYSDAKTP